MDSNEKMLTVGEFAKKSGWSVDVVRRAIKAKQIQAFKLPRIQEQGKREYNCYRIPERELWRWRCEAA